MAKIITKDINDKNIWEDFLSKRPEANFLQSWYWGEFHETLGNRIQRTGFYYTSKLIGVMLSIIEDARRARYLTVPGGPILEWDNPMLVKRFALELKNLCIKTSCSFARVRPQLVDDHKNRELFKKLGFKKAPMYLHAELTSQLDITRTENELLASMRKSTRYEIKKAISQGIVIERNGAKNIRNFYKLQLATAKRQKFIPFSKKYLEAQFDIFIKNNKAILYTARYKNKLLTQAFVIFYGEEAVYHYGASSDEGRKYPGAYLIQWEAIKEAKSRGIRRYNFWGVSPVHKASHRFAGLSLFKRGFGGHDVEYLPAQDLVLRKIPYLINYFIEALRKNLRGL